MLCHLPRPYPDELLYSIITRYCLYLGINVGVFARKVFGKRSIKFRADLPGSLQSIAEKTYPLWGLSSDDVLNKLTLFPYYEPFLSEKTASKKIFGLIHGGTAAAGLIGVNSFRVKSPVFLRFCTACRSLDLKNFEETYWRRMHQLPGTLVCLEHGTRLVNSSALIQPMHAEIGDATFATKDILESDVYLDDNELNLAIMIAVHSRNVLLNNNSAWQSRDHAKAYRDAAIERGFSRIPGIFSPSKFKLAFKDFFCGGFLEKIGISSENDEWITTIFHKDRRQQVHPLEHVLVQVFLEQMPVVASSQPFGLSPWKCPNPYGEHDDKFPIKKILIRTNGAKEVVACVRCSCGFFFTFEKVDEKDMHLPVVKDVSAYGSTWKQKALSLLKYGMSVHEISAVMSLPVQYVSRLIAFKSKRSNRPFKSIAIARKEWLQKIERSSITEARKHNYGLYQFLRKYDHDWMISQTRPRQKKVDLEERDFEWSQLLEAAALSIASKYPGRRIAKTLMIKVAGLNLRLMAELDNFPKCKSVMDRLSESRDKYQDRQAK